MPELDARMTEFVQAGAKLLDVADRQLVLSMRRDLRALAKPASERVLNALADAMPKRGGLADRIRSQGRISLLVDLRRGVRVQMSNKAGMYMGAFESGTIRHPVWGNRKVWRPQQVPGGAGWEQFQKESPVLADQVVAKVTETVRRAL